MKIGQFIEILVNLDPDQLHLNGQEDPEAGLKIQMHQNARDQAALLQHVPRVAHQLLSNLRVAHQLLKDLKVARPQPSILEDLAAIRATQTLLESLKSAREKSSRTLIPMMRQQNNYR